MVTVRGILYCTFLSRNKQHVVFSLQLVVIRSCAKTAATGTWRMVNRVPHQRIMERKILRVRESCTSLESRARVWPSWRCATSALMSSTPHSTTSRRLHVPTLPTTNCKLGLFAYSSDTVTVTFFSRLQSTFCHLEDWPRQASPWLHWHLQRHSTAHWTSRLCALKVRSKELCKGLDN